MSRSPHHAGGDSLALMTTVPGDEGAAEAGADGMKVALAEFDALRQEIVSARTAQGAVLGAGLTVVLAMSTLFLIDLPVIRSLALGAVVVVSVAIVVNLLVDVIYPLLDPRIARVRPVTIGGGSS